MNNNTATLQDGQAPARRIGAFIAIIITCMSCACITGIWYVFAREGINTLTQRISLAGNGITTTGTVTYMEEFSSAKAGLPGTRYMIALRCLTDL